MTKAGEIFFKKDKDIWIAYDRDGNFARGLTKNHAKNNYLLVYGELVDDIKLGFDMSNVDRRL